MTRKKEGCSAGFPLFMFIYEERNIYVKYVLMLYNYCVNIKVRGGAEMEKIKNLDYWGIEERKKYQMLVINKICFNDVRVKFIKNQRTSFSMMRLFDLKNKVICGIILSDIKSVNY